MEITGQDKQSYFTLKNLHWQLYFYIYFFFYKQGYTDPCQDGVSMEKNQAILELRYSHKHLSSGLGELNWL